MIEIKHLSKTFQMKDGAVNALKDINLTIPDGSIYGITILDAINKFLSDYGSRYLCIVHVREKNLGTIPPANHKGRNHLTFFPHK